MLIIMESDIACVEIEMILLAGPGLVETGYYSLPNKDCGRYWEFNCDYHLNCF